MIIKDFQNFVQLYYRPLTAIGNIIDQGNFLFGAIAVLVISLTLGISIHNNIHATYEAVPTTVALSVEERAYYLEAGVKDSQIPKTRQVIKQLPLPLIGNAGWWVLSFDGTTTLSTIVRLAVLYLPVTILLLIMLESMGSFSVVLRRDYGPLLACCLMAWAAAHLPLAIVGIALKGQLTAVHGLILLLIAKLFFGLLMVISMRAIFACSIANAVITLSISWLSIVFQPMLFIIATPCIFLYVYGYIRGDVGGDIISSFHRRQSFRRYLEACTVNPRDAEAHYQLGLIYQHRRQYSEAIERFTRAIEIDKRETDAHFQLGRIAREQGRLQEALNFFNTVLSQDEKHSHHEIWREIGATYQAASMYDDAFSALEKYVAVRQYDPEGLYYYGKTLKGLGRLEQAQAALKQCIEAVKTSPDYRRGQIRRWQKLAQDEMRATQTAAQPAGA